MKVILFDGVCNLCNGSVNWVIDRDKKNQFKFSALQSDFAKKRLSEIGYHDYMDSIVLDDDGKIFTESDAALKVLTYLGGIYSASIAFWIVPKFLRNAIYRFIAKNRYKWFGKRDACRIPTPELLQKFL